MDVRPAEVGDIPGIARVHVDTWRATYRGVVPDAVLDGLSYEAKERTWRRGGLDYPTGTGFAYVATDEGTVVGFASGGPSRDGDGCDAELYALYVAPGHQGRGLGRRLYDAVVTRHARRNASSMIVWVLTANPACRFYEHLGAKRVAAKTIEIGGAELEELGYAFSPLPAMLA